MTVYEQHYSVFGDAEPYRNGSRVWPKQVLVSGRRTIDPKDAWLVLEGIVLQGLCVVGLRKTGRTLQYGHVSWDPSPDRFGPWRSISKTCGKAHWARVRRKTAWERLARTRP